MAIKIKAVERKLMVGPKAGQYVYQMAAETYSSLAESKVIEEASLRSGIQKGALQAAFTAIGDVIKVWATEGHSVPVAGLGTMRFSVNANSVADVNMVASSLITTRKIVFTPSTDVKKALKDASVSITCYDRNGNVVKRVNSGDAGEIEGPENADGGGSGGGSDTTEKYLLTLAVNDPQMGSVSGGGEYAGDTQVELKATANSGYEFVKWSDGDTNATRTYTTAYEAETLTAEFKATADDGGEMGE